MMDIDNERMRFVKHPFTVLGFLYLVIIILTLCLAGCGTRKTGLVINKSSEQSKEQSSSQGQVKKESGSEASKSSEEKTNTSDENLVKKVEELYNENGTLKSRITTLEKQKKTDNSSKSSNSREKVYY